MTAVNQWTAPKNVIGGESSDAAFWNTYLRDNMTWLKSRPFISGSTGTVTTTSTSFVEMTNSSISLTTTGGYIFFWAVGWSSNATGGAVNTFDLAIDGVRQTHATFGATLIQGLTANYGDCLSLMMTTGGGVGGSLLGAGAHTCAIHWKVSAGTGSAALYMFALEEC